VHDNNPLLVSVPEGQRQLGIGKTKIFELIATGAIETVTIGRRRLIVAASLRDYVDRLANAA
jgi:excisionase family DNA binding protein